MEKTLISSVLQIGQNPPKHSDTITWLFTVDLEKQPWRANNATFFNSARRVSGKTTARLVILMQPSQRRETPAINIEILSDTSKPPRNEPLYL